jgi:hypothetical protein
LRLAAAAGFLLGLSGCNMVVSEEPWFTEAEAQPKPKLRDGLWVNAAPDCRFDEARPAERWPDCAEPAFVRGGETWTMRWDPGEPGQSRRIFAGWESGDPFSGGLLVTNGDHLIVQDKFGDELGEAPPGETEEGNSQGYMYAALRLRRQDEQGKVTAMEMWAVQCGPISEPERSAAERRRLRDDPDYAEEANYVTDDPFSGLTIVDNNCIAESAEAVRNAAVLSEALRPPTQLRWIRDGWR